MGGNCFNNFSNYSYKRNEKNIYLKLIYVTFYEIEELYITNRGKKPVTILEVGIRKLPKKYEAGGHDEYDLMPYFPAFDELDQPKLPLKLSEGESVKFIFDLDYDFITNETMIAYARDATGKEFTTRDIYGYNGKFHVYEGRIK